MSKNISKEKREELLREIGEIREYLEKNTDENAGRLLTYLANLEKDVDGKKYGLVFEEHEEAVDVLCRDNVPILKEVEELKIENGGTQNFLIEGDNLASLKLLEKTHKGRIDLIYIDPPYNTKNKDFVYDDVFVGEEDEFRHSKWLSFMANRLMIARKLLSKNGVIFISIDDNELSTLHLLCDHVFGEKNFIGQFHWLKSKTPPNLSKKIKKQLEYVLCYEKNKDNIEYEGVQKSSKSDDPFTKPQNSIKQLRFPAGSISVCIQDGIYKAGIYGTKAFPNTMLNDMIVANGKNKNDVIFQNKFIWTQDTLEKNIYEGVNIFIRAKSLVLSYKRKSYGKDIPSNLIDLTVGADTTENASKKLVDLLGKKCFDYPKDIGLIKYLLSFKKFNDPIVLDFFAGSGTTGHAVMELNAEDGGNRKFILCTNNENNICREITYERVKRVIEKENYNASLKYMKVDFIPINEQLYYEYADKLLLHIKELVELENGLDFNGNNKVAICLTDKELSAFASGVYEETTFKRVYVGHDVLLTPEIEDKLLKANIRINIIPDYYYGELRG